MNRRVLWIRSRFGSYFGQTGQVLLLLDSGALVLSPTSIAIRVSGQSLRRTGFHRVRIRRAGYILRHPWIRATLIQGLDEVGTFQSARHFLRLVCSYL